jgi:hypothetical protein
MNYFTQFMLLIYDRVLCDDIEGLALFRSVENDRVQLGGLELLIEFRWM